MKPTGLLVLLCLGVTTAAAQSADPLPSWNDEGGTDFMRAFAEREWSYDVSPLGKLEKGLEEANAKGWTVGDMKTDWKVVYPPGKD